MRAEPVTDPIADHGEGPIWDDRTSELLWVDMLRGDVLAIGADGAVERRPVSDVAACVVPRSGGGHCVATERGFLLLDAAGHADVLDDLWTDASVRMNDGGCDPHGRFWCGSMAYDETPGAGALYRLDPDHTVHRAFGDVTISNGLGWSPDGQTAYYVDTPTQQIDECSPDFARRRCLATIPDDAGAPDGLTVDADGGVWVALWGGRAVRRYTPDGRLDELVEVPVRQVTACAFGGDDLATLYITTSRHGLADPEPSAGALYAIRTDVSGLPTQEFSG